MRYIEAQRARDLLTRLPDHQRELVLLRVVAGLSAEERQRARHVRGRGAGRAAPGPGAAPGDGQRGVDRLTERGPGTGIGAPRIRRSPRTPAMPRPRPPRPGPRPPPRRLREPRPKSRLRPRRPRRLRPQGRSPGSGFSPDAPPTQAPGASGRAPLRTPRRLPGPGVPARAPAAPVAPTAPVGATGAASVGSGAVARSAAVDLAAVRRTDALIEALAARCAPGSAARPADDPDPAVRLLRALITDVDEQTAPPAPSGPGPRRRGPRTIVALGVAGAVLASTGVAAAGSGVDHQPSAAPVPRSSSGQTAAPAAGDVDAATHDRPGLRRVRNPSRPPSRPATPSARTSNASNAAWSTCSRPGTTAAARTSRTRSRARPRPPARAPTRATTTCAAAWTPCAAKPKSGQTNTKAPAGTTDAPLPRADGPTHATPPRRSNAQHRSGRPVRKIARGVQCAAPLRGSRGTASAL